jgi:hypothetical protein
VKYRNNYLIRNEKMYFEQELFELLVNWFIWRTIVVLDYTIVYRFYNRNYDSRFLVNLNLFKVFQQTTKKHIWIFF